MSGEKTELPTRKRLRDARKKGQVAHSKEVSSTVLLLGMFVYFIVGGEWIYQQLIEMIDIPTGYYTVPFNEALPAVVTGVIGKIVVLSLPGVGVVILGGIGANYFQVGPLFSTEPLTPNLSKLNPAEKLKQMFSMKNFMEFIKSSVKVVFLGILIYHLIRDSIPVLIYVPYDGLDGVLRALNALLYRLAIVTSFAYIVIAVADFVFQRKQHTKQLMMTKQEVKQEHKENEGDPTIKGKRKELHRELANGEAVKRTKNATALVTNPTHYAIALQYEKGVTPLPILLAKGKGPLALRMMEVAREEGIPVMQNVPLARALYAEAKVDQFVPRDLIEAVAEVLRVVQRMRREQELEQML